MNQTQKNCIKFWTKLLLVVTISLVLLVGMFTGSKICMIFVGGICLGVIGFGFALWIAERVYLWRIMGVCDPQEWEVVKWYKFSLLNGGPNWIIAKLAKEAEPNQWHIAIFEKIANQVKIPRILLDKSDEP